MTHQVFGPLDSIHRSITLSLQYTPIAAPSWSEVRETGKAAASRLKSCVENALYSCTRKANENPCLRKASFSVKQCCIQTKLLVSPQADFENRVRKETGFPREVIQL